MKHCMNRGQLAALLLVVKPYSFARAIMIGQSFPVWLSLFSIKGQERCIEIGLNEPQRDSDYPLLPLSCDSGKIPRDRLGPIVPTTDHAWRWGFPQLLPAANSSIEPSCVDYPSLNLDRDRTPLSSSRARSYHHLVQFDHAPAGLVELSLASSASRAGFLLRYPRSQDLFCVRLSKTLVVVLL